MVGPSKILTVSYGTFSCTLEGFDDPFSTMRGIAEYFRDLAADDRYFGAEPPTPDAEMLHRIAEKEIQRKVESRLSPTGIVLRQAGDGAEAEQSVAEVDEPIQPAAPSEPISAAADVAGVSTVAERLARIRGVVAQNDDGFAEEDLANTPFDQGAEAEEEAVADEVEPVQAEADQADDDTLEEKEAEADEETDVLTADEEVDASLEDELEHTTVAAVEADADADADAQDESALLSDIMAAQQDGADDNATDELIAEQEPENVAQEHEAESFDEDSAELDIEALADVLDAAEEEPSELEEHVLEDDAEPEEASDESAFDLADFDVAQEEAEETAEPALEVVAEDDEISATTSNLRDEPSSFADLIAAEKEIAQAEIDEDETTDDDNEDGGVTRLVRMRLNDAAARAQMVAGEHDEDASEPLKLAAEDAVDDYTEEQDDQPPEALGAENSSLSDADEMELQAELARLNGNAAGDDEPVEPEIAEDVQADVVPEISPRPARPVSRPEGVRVERLLEVTNNEMADGEGSRRRSAIAHLKAAVAATRADREAASVNAEEVSDEIDDISSYREDLARVVRPRRLADGARNVVRRLAPLVLVSEQRIEDEQAEDMSAEEETGAVRPRRVSGNEVQDDQAEESENIFSEAGSFAEFARDVGATELPDLLEAAAAYYHFVEGQPHFSRPQVMNAVAAVDEDGGFSREEGLRSFGMLLRRGKFRKIRRGQFEIAESTRFRPELQAGE